MLMQSRQNQQDTQSRSMASVARSGHNFWSQQESHAVTSLAGQETVQRVGDEEDMPAMGKFIDPVQRVGMEEEDEPAMGKFISQRQSQGSDTGEQSATTEQPRPNNTGLPDNLKSGIENLSGYSMDDVKVHFNSSKPAQLNAHAYAQGTSIHVAPGQEKHLPHEAWHVVQQKQGRVKPTMQLKQGVPVNDDAGLEREADVMGERALKNEDSKNYLDHSPKIGEASSIAQLRTVLTFDANIDGNTIVRSVDHGRAGVHQQSRNWVLNNGAWTAVPAGEVCNHSHSYQNIAAELIEQMETRSISNALGYVSDIYVGLGNQVQGAMTQDPYRNDVENWVNNPGNTVDHDTVNAAANYYIYKIADFPANLFFHPNKSNQEPDEPADYTFALGWTERDNTLTNAQRTQGERNRVTNGRGVLENFVNL